MARRGFPCGHQGKGQYCHRCRQEAEHTSRRAQDSASQLAQRQAERLAWEATFIDDVASCGVTCSFCQKPTLDNATVNALARAYVVAFYGRYLRDNAGYDTYMTGVEAKQRYVDMGLIAIQTK